MSADHEQTKAKSSHAAGATTHDDKSVKPKPMKHPVLTSDKKTWKEAPANTKGRIIGRRSDHDMVVDDQVIRAEKPGESWTWILIGRGQDDGVGANTPAVLDHPKRYEVIVRETNDDHTCWAVVQATHEEIAKSSMQVIFNPE